MYEMRDSFVELMFAKECLEQYQDLSLSDMFLEETNEIKETNKNNENLLHKATTAVGSAIKKLIDMIKDCIDRVKEFISTRFMSKEQRLKYKQLKQAAMSNPSLGNKLVEIESFAPYDAVYNEGINRLNKLEKSGDFSEESANGIIADVNNKINDIKNKTKGVATRTTLKSAIQIAEKDALFAQGLNRALNSELISLEDLIGENDANRYKKDASKSTKKAIIHRLKAGLLRKQQDSLLDCLKSQVNTLMTDFTDINKPDNEREYTTKNGKVKKSIISTSSILHGVGKHSKQINDIAGHDGASDKIAYNIAGRSNDPKGEIKQYKKIKRKIFKKNI